MLKLDVALRVTDDSFLVIFLHGAIEKV